MKIWSKVRRVGFALVLIGTLAAWISERHPGPALIGLGCVYVAVALLVGPVLRASGFPAFRADEAYGTTLRRWRRERRSTLGR